MVIAVDIRGSGKYQHFIYENFKRIAAQHPRHSFLFIFDKPFDPSFIFSQNIIPVIIQPKKISLLNDHKISSLLKEYKVGVFVTTKTIKTNVPQCLIAWDKFTAGSLKKAQVIVTASAFSKKEITRYKIDENKIDVVYKGVNEIYPIAFEEKEKIKEEYANGNEYFLCWGSIQPDNLLNLLKAFSVFKKMQKSGMQLLIAPQETGKEFLETLRLYKFKSEVKIVENNTGKLAGITAAAYAFVYSVTNADYSKVLEAMSCNVPVITGNEKVIPEICGGAALYFDNNNYKDIADKMMLIFKDENVRQQLIEKGKEQVKKYTWDNTADSLWKSIEKACR
ncbi:MAG: glycosyltransferase family 4 protein [Chitinophagaceae bacterium]|nr:glycosyltransferase family 4 protein [Chitinophagaceae bacterium]